MKSSKRHDRASQLYRLLTRPHQPPVSLRWICNELECSRSTAKRLIEDLRTRFDHPIVYDKERNGYFYDETPGTSAGVELPGLWFTEPELFALLTVRKLINDIEPGLFENDVAPLGQRVAKLLEEAGADVREVDRRIRVTSIGRRTVPPRTFRACANALLQRRRIAFTYKTRGRPDSTEATRNVSPQRLVHYRNNWYLDGWDHDKEALRIFAVDEIRDVATLKETAIDVDDASIDKYVAGGYGIFGGESTQTAVLRFSAARAAWVSKELWHEEQVGRFLEDGSYELRVPYSREEELVMDVLRHGGDVEVLGPVGLREVVAGKLREAVGRYV